MLIDVTGSWYVGLCKGCGITWMYRTNADAPGAATRGDCPRCWRQDCVQWGWIRIEEALVSDGEKPLLKH